MNRSTKSNISKGKNINISSLKQDIKNLRHTFELIQIPKKLYQKKCTKKIISIFFFFLSQEAGTSGNDIEKEPQKPHPKLKKY